MRLFTRRIHRSLIQALVSPIVHRPATLANTSMIPHSPLRTPHFKGPACKLRSYSSTYLRCYCRDRTPFYDRQRRRESQSASWRSPGSRRRGLSFMQASLSGQPLKHLPHNPHHPIHNLSGPLQGLCSSTVQPKPLSKHRLGTLRSLFSDQQIGCLPDPPLNQDPRMQFSVMISIRKGQFFNFLSSMSSCQKDPMT